ncbi:Protein CBG23981 [Caenorhabditis briggsae]|uniref:Protein CBG23981 n=1 Tax=Caenorhabditis briggsae TaxID=6238 RepID=A8WJQ3_CAEBR|nr:Protein CBG23981 [Caenorhabditis briggsae]CAP20696.1 Protein CBG23981 [Caenorhabditis briggsae]
MNEADVKEQVIEEEHDFTVKNGEYVEVKNEEIEQKTENLLENEIKMKADEFLEDVELKPKESESKIENKMPKNYSMLKCEICQDTVPRNLLKMIRTEDEKIVLSEIFEVKGSMGKTTPYVCLSHIRKVISDNDGKLKIPITSFEHHLRAFIRRNKYSMNDSKSRKRYCHVCHTSNDCNKLYTVSSKSVRMVIMIGCILRGTHSIEQAIPFITANLGFACHSHCKKSIDTIFEYLEVRNVLELSWCSVQAMGSLMDIVKKINLNFTEYQFIDACRGLVLKSKTF